VFVVAQMDIMFKAHQITYVLLVPQIVLIVVPIPTVVLAHQRILLLMASVPKHVNLECITFKVVV